MGVAAGDGEGEGEREKRTTGEKGAWKGNSGVDGTRLSGIAEEGRWQWSVEGEN